MRTDRTTHLLHASTTQEALDDAIANQTPVESICGVVWIPAYKGEDASSNFPFCVDCVRVLQHERASLATWVIMLTNLLDRMVNER